MALQPQQTQRQPSIWVLVVCCLLSITTMTIWVREGSDGRLHRLRDACSLVTAPLQSVGSGLTAPLRRLSVLVDDNGLTADEVEAMRRENEQMRNELVRMQEMELENQRMGEMLGLRDAYHLDMVGARVINRTNTSTDRTITINKGSNAGILPYMPVLSQNGLVGQVESIGPSSAVVRLITDRNSAVPVYIQATRTEGIVEGSVDGTLYLRYIGLDTRLEVGAMIITSGLGGVYPKGVPIGTVQSIDFLPSDVYMTIVIKPLDRGVSFEEVLVITGSESDNQPATDDVGGSLELNWQIARLGQKYMGISTTACLIAKPPGVGIDSPRVSVNSPKGGFR